MRRGNNTIVLCVGLVFASYVGSYFSIVYVRSLRVTRSAPSPSGLALLAFLGGGTASGRPSGRPSGCVFFDYSSHARVDRALSVIFWPAHEAARATNILQAEHVTPAKKKALIWLLRKAEGGRWYKRAWER